MRLTRLVLALPGAADDADGLPRADGEVNVPQDGLVGVLLIGKVHVAELHRAVGNLVDGVCGVGQVGSSRRTSEIRSTLATLMVTMTKIIESIMRLMRMFMQ